MSSFAIFGSSLRVYLARFLGSDCALSSPSNSSWPYYQDTIHHHHLYLCVTSSSNALFIDLPSNMLGCFFMGVLSGPPIVVHGSSSTESVPSLPWLRPNHKMQFQNHIHVSLRSAFCGSLTTFSSWNTAMVLLIVTTLTGEETNLGSGFASALLGYFLGMTCCIMSFWIGRDFATLLYRWRTCERVKEGDDGLDLNAPLDPVPMDRLDAGTNDALELQDHVQNMSTNNTKDDTTKPTCIIHCCKTTYNHLNRGMDQILHWDYLPLLGAIILVMLYIIGHVVFHQSFYKQMWMSSLFSVPGALLRWKLGEWFNKDKLFQQRENWKWIPWGTMIANVVASIVSIVITSSMTRVSKNQLQTFNYSSYGSIVGMSLKVGFAGSLSTVSTFVKEIVDLYDPYSPSAGARSYIYATGSIFICCILCTALYHMIIYI